MAPLDPLPVNLDHVSVLEDMGAAMTCLGGVAEGRLTVLPETSLRPHPITAGVTSLVMAASSVVSLGPDDIPLFFNRANDQVLGAVAIVNLAPTN